MQWSQLLTGVLAGAMWLVSRVSSPAFAEWAVRLCWPIALILPCVAACLTAARRLSAPSALLPAAILLLITPDLYLQFVPGRIDHHNVQITLAVAAFAAALAPAMKTRAAALAGLFSGLGLAIGLEAMFFHALVGASFALRLAADREDTDTAKAYGLALLASTVGFYAVQTPPWRWSLSFCDSLGLNVVLAVFSPVGALRSPARWRGGFRPRRGWAWSLPWASSRPAPGWPPIPAAFTDRSWPWIPGCGRSGLIGSSRSSRGGRRSPATVTPPSAR